MIFKIIRLFFNRTELNNEFHSLTVHVEKLHKLFDSDMPWFYDGWGLYPDEDKLHKMEFELNVLTRVFYNDYLIWKLSQ